MKEKGLFAAVRAFFVYNGDEAESNLTGVARYLREHIEPACEASLGSGTVTGVAKYLEELDSGDQGQEEPAHVEQAVDDIEEVQVRETPVREAVAPVSVSPQGKGLFAAIRSFFVYSDDAPASQLTGVARYLQEHIEVEPEADVELEVASGAVLRSEATTGVARYLEQSDSSETRISAAAEAVMALESVDSDNSVINTEYSEISEERAEESESATGVAKYMEEQALIESELPLITGVEMYLQDQAAAKLDAAASTSVGEYLDQACAQSEAAAIIAKYQEQNEEEVQETMPVLTSVDRYVEVNILSSEQEAGSTSVVDYLERSDKIAEAEAIIARYHERQSVNEEADLPVPSGVACYVEALEQDAQNAAASGVTAYMEKSIKQSEVAEIIARYLERERIAKERQEQLKPQENRVSVVKIRNRKPSSVARYVSQLGLDEITSSAELSGVGKYMMDQEAEAKEQAAAEIIARFEERQKALLEGQTVVSGVARYIQNLPASEPVSSVDKYLANRTSLIVEEVPAPKSSVSRYLDEQKEAVDETRPASGVARYLANQLIAANTAPVEKLSGVDRYVLSQDY